MRRIAIVALALFSLMAAVPAAAHEASWRVSRTDGSLGGYKDVGATGGDDAWVVRTGQPLLRWNGSAWRNTAGGAPPYLVTSAGRGEAWQFAESLDRVDARQLTGGRWHARPIEAAGAHATAALATSPVECWVAGLRSGARGMRDVVWHWTGRRWSEVSSPLPITDFAASSPKDVWALSSLGAASPAHAASILRLTDSGWRRSPAPSISLPSRSRIGDAYAELHDIVALGPDEAYAVGGISFIIGEERVMREALVLRWNGTLWERLPHRPAGTSYSRVAPDGAGGLWLATRRQDLPDVLTHREGRRWTRTPVGKVTLNGLANVPGTRTMWATAETREAGVTRQLILSYR
ncbi:hypothetical protein ACIBEJ_18790 [Nonomuraea sp. NPDC050790]|uniref:hypothetical protein n=1 Tax=Nonomuraea sp. NPDC050790 TaxID=3364371 RepID=UPI0037B9C2A7